MIGANANLNLFRNNVIPVLVDIIRNSQKEKVTRIILATLRVSVENLLCKVIFKEISFFSVKIKASDLNSEKMRNHKRCAKNSSDA